jgi:hypothetical protein
MTEDEAIEMAENGFEIGNHTWSHWSNDQWLDTKFRDWDPVQDQPGLVYSLEADDLPDQGYASGDPVTIWDSSFDASGGYDASPVRFVAGWSQSPSISPVYSGTINSHPAVKFDTVNGDNVRSRTAYMPPGGFTMFFVAYIPEWADENRIMFDCRAENGTSDRIIFAHEMSGQEFFTIYTDTDGYTYTALQTPTTAEPQLLALICKENEGLRIWKNGGGIGGSGTYTNTSIDWRTTGFVTIGNQYNGSSTNGFDGWIGETALIDYPLSNEERQIYEGYLANKWSFTLPEAHPYHDASPRAKDNANLQTEKLYYEIYGNKNKLERMLNYDDSHNFQSFSSDFTSRRKRIHSYAYAGGGDWLFDNHTISTVALGHTGARTTGTNTSDDVYGRRSLTYKSSTWWKMNPHAVANTNSISDIAVNANPDATYNNMLNAMINLSEANKYEGANVWANVFWHKEESPEYVNEANLRSMLQAVADINATGNIFWVAPFGDAMEYWMDAHPDIPEPNRRGWW